MWSSAPPIGFQGCRHLLDPQSRQCATDHQFARKLHAGAIQLKSTHRVGSEGAKATMEVAYRNAEKKTPKKAQDGISNVFVHKGHGTWLNAALETISYDNVGAASQSLYEWTKRCEIVAVVCISHNDVTTTSRCYTSQ